MQIGNVYAEAIFSHTQHSLYAATSLPLSAQNVGCIARAERDGTRAETRFRLSPKRTTPFKSVGASVQSTAGSRGVRTSFSNAGYTMFGGGVRVLATHSIRQFPLHFPTRASPCATRFRTSSTTNFVSNLPVAVPQNYTAIRQNALSSKTIIFTSFKRVHGQ